MRTIMWGLAVAGVLACDLRTSRTDRVSAMPLEQGRTYTEWLYGREYQKLWDRFSPEMRETFGSASELASFAGRAVQQLGPEKGSVEEQVAEERPFRVYTRTAAFDRVRERMAIQWSLTADGRVTGLAVSPVSEGPVRR
jgi:hypothetical protein